MARQVARLSSSTAAVLAAWPGRGRAAPPVGGPETEERPERKGENTRLPAPTPAASRPSGGRRGIDEAGDGAGDQRHDLRGPWPSKRKSGSHLAHPASMRAPACGGTKLSRANAWACREAAQPRLRRYRSSANGRRDEDFAEHLGDQAPRRASHRRAGWGHGLPIEHKAMQDMIFVEPTRAGIAPAGRDSARSVAESARAMSDLRRPHHLAHHADPRAGGADCRAGRAGWCTAIFKPVDVNQTALAEAEQPTARILSVFVAFEAKHPEAVAVGLGRATATASGCLASKATKTEGSLRSWYSSSASASAVWLAIDQCTGLRSRYTSPARPARRRPRAPPARRSEPW